MELSEEFIEKMKHLLGNEIDDFISSLESPEQKGITVNFSRLNKETFESSANFDIENIPHIDNGYYVGSIKFAENKFNHMGVIYSQEPSAMYPVELLDIQPNDIVLDVCASPGGKSIQILEKLNKTGLLVSNEINFSRNKILFENLSRMGFSNVIITCDSPETYSKTNLKFDKILIDAPCGGEGMIRKNSFDPNAFSSLNIETNANRQLSILNSIKDLLKPNGILVYSTCTYDMRENELVIARFLSDNPDFEIIPPKTNFDDVMRTGFSVENFHTEYSYRRYPHIHRGEGQFMIALRKNDSETNFEQKFKIKNFETPNKKELDIIKKTLTPVLPDLNFNLLKRNDTIFIAPNINLDISRLNITHIGCVLGTLQKDILKIHHNFYHTFGDKFFHKIELSESDLNKYLHGEELDTDQPNSICAISHMGVAIGGGKIVNNKIKNYYPKELRI